MESFFTNTGLELYFGKVGPTATDYIKKELGETEVVRIARNQTVSRNESKSISNSIAFGKTSSEGGSESSSESHQSSHTSSKQFGWSDTIDWSDSKNWGQGIDTSMGRNYGPHIFFQGFQHSNNYGAESEQKSGTHQFEGRRHDTQRRHWRKRR